jgi:hypothetical protein
MLVSYNLTYIAPGFNYADYWPSEYLIVNPSNYEPAGFFSLKDDSKNNAGLGIGRTCLVCLILLIGALMFTNLTNNMVIKPIVEMINTVKKISANPLVASQEEDKMSLIQIKKSL